MKTKMLVTLVALFLVAAGVVAYSAPTLAQDSTPYPPLETCPLDDGVFTVAWIPKALNNPVFELGRIAAETRAEELTEEGPCEVEVFYAAPMSSTAEEQAELISDVAELDNIDAIGVSCIDPEICIEPINLAVALGKAVMTWDSDAPDSDRLTYLGIDNFEGGQAAGDLLIRAMGESGQVALLSGVESSANLNQRIDGFVDYVADYPDIEILTTVYCDDLAPLAVELIEETMTEYPELDGWFMVGLWPFFAGRDAMPQWNAAAEAGDLVTVTFDTLPLELDLVKDDLVQGLVGQKYWGWGYDTVQMLYEHALYGREFDDFTNSGMDIVTLLNVEAMIEAWETNDFTQQLPEPFEDTGEDADE